MKGRREWERERVGKKKKGRWGERDEVQRRTKSELLSNRDIKHWCLFSKLAARIVVIIVGC